MFNDHTLNVKIAKIETSLSKIDKKQDKLEEWQIQVVTLLGKIEVLMEKLSSLDDKVDSSISRVHEKLDLFDKNKASSTQTESLENKVKKLEESSIANFKILSIPIFLIKHPQLTLFFLTSYALSWVEIRTAVFSYFGWK